MRIRALKFCLVCIVALSAQARHANATPILEQTLPLSVSYVFGVDFSQLTESPLGEVTAGVSAVDLLFGPGNPSSSGCEAADFAGFIVGSIALLQRGTCTYALKALNAEAAGAVGVLIFNQGDTPAREGLIEGTLNAGFPGSIPVFGLPYALGVEFASAPRLIVRMVAEEIDESEVPAPATLMLVSLGLAGLNWSRRRRIHRR